MSITSLHQPKFIAITGGSGAGKTWLAERLQDLLGDAATRVMLDSFYRDRSSLPMKRREAINYDHPRAIDWALLEQWLYACRAGTVTSVPRYDFKTHTRLPDQESWSPKPLVLIEGLWLLRRLSIRTLFAVRIFVDCPAPLRFRQRLERDCVQRGRTASSIRRQYMETVAPMYELFVAPQKRYADLVLKQPFQHSQILELAGQLLQLLRPEAISARRIRTNAAMKMGGQLRP